MEREIITIRGCGARVYRADAIVVGTGCAGLNAADRLHHYGKRNLIVLADHVTAGTSRNTGSDKQTYYKLTLAGDEPDSVRLMAETLFSGGCVDGEHALCEAALSAKCFLRLCELGVPFPVNRYGEYVGYKTDHDPSRRATSAGPLTSRAMTEALERSVREKGIEIHGECPVIRILTHEGRAVGVLCLAPGGQPERFRIYLARDIVYATGGPAGIYRDSCYPTGHFGASGLAFEAGAKGKNLTEWQYGLASIRPRWNVSGSFMQVLPRFVSTDPDGDDEREFLQDHLPDPGRLLTSVFLKGYQWPFDVRKALGGSSLIDLIVYAETKLKGRRVYLDFRRNPLGDRFDFGALSEEARGYLKRAGALFGAPIERLERMNAPAIEFYRSRGVDLYSQPLEIALCSQHNNGGVAVDGWWQSDVKHLFVVGEAAASHGVTRPGGSALNAGQVGSERAARCIAAQPAGPADMDAWLRGALGRAEEMIALAQGAQSGESNVERLQEEAMREMSVIGAAVRDAGRIEALAAETREKLENFAGEVRVASDREYGRLFRYRDTLISQLTYLSAMADYVRQGGRSRGSGLYTDPAGVKPLETLPECCRFTPDDGALLTRVQEAQFRDGQVACAWRAVRPIPREDDFFENVWREFREHGNVH